MAGLDDAMAGLKGFFYQNDLNDPRVNSAMRQKIALAMMSSKKGYPKTIGEGLTAIGDAIGDRAMANALARADLAQQAAGVQAYDQGQQTAQPAEDRTSEAEPPLVAPQGVVAGGMPLPPPPGAQAAPPVDAGATPAAPATALATPGAPVTPAQAALARDRVAVASLAGQGVPQPNPTPEGASEPPGGQPPDPRMASLDANAVPIQRAPPPQAPPVQMAQAQGLPPARYDYVMPPPGAPTAPPVSRPSADEQRLERMLIANQGNPYVVTGLTRQLQELQARRAAADKFAAEQFQNQLLQQRELEMKRQEQIQSRARLLTEGKQAEATLTQTTAQNLERAGFGNMNPAEVYKNLDASKTLAQSAANGLSASNDARAALAGGAILGSGANLRLDIAKLVTGMGLADKGNVIANTETFRAAMQPIVASLLHQTSGTSQLSEGELRFAKDAAAGNIQLDAKTIPKLLDIIDRRANELIDRHDKLVGTMFENNPKAQTMYGVERPAPYRPPAAGGRIDVNSEEEAMRLPKGTKIRINGRNATVQ